jgi:hypothetical protein
MDASSKRYHSENAAKLRVVLDESANNSTLLARAKKALAPHGLDHALCSASRMSKYGIGGASHSNWVAGLFKDGVYLRSDNYKTSVSCTESPHATLTRGCQESCAYADPWPKPSEGKWVAASTMPESAQPRIDAAVRELLEDVASVIEAKAEMLDKERAQKRAEREQREAAIADAWRD